MSQTVARADHAAEFGGWRLHPGTADTRSLILLHGGKVVHRLTYSGYARTTGELRAVGVTEVGAKVLALRIAGRVTSGEGDGPSPPWDVVVSSWD